MTALTETPVKTIRIDDEVWATLQTRAEPFTDTPNTVLRRLLGLSENRTSPTDVAGAGAGARGGRPRYLPGKTFAAKADADHWLSLVEADLARGTWVDPRAGQVTLETYAAEWLDARPKPLRRRTRELYEGQLDHHILPVLGGYQLRHLTTNV